jgi:hypothetical protein
VTLTAKERLLNKLTTEYEYNALQRFLGLALMGVAGVRRKIEK